MATKSTKSVSFREPRIDVPRSIVLISFLCIFVFFVAIRLAAPHRSGLKSLTTKNPARRSRNQIKNKRDAGLATHLIGRSAMDSCL
jgi:hypothetical protein